MSEPVPERYDEETLRALADEQSRTEQAEQEVEALLLALLLSAGAASAVPSLPAIHDAVEPVVTPLVLFIAYDLLVRAGRPTSTTDLRPFVAQAVARTTQQVVTAVASGASKRSGDVMDRDVEGPKGAGKWAESIASTIVTTVNESVKEQVARSTSYYTHKRWLTQLDERVRPSHRVLEGVTVDADSFFITQSGSAMTGPHDHSAPMAEWINCRCRLLWIRKAKFLT